MRIPLFFCSLLISLSAFADVYKTVDKDGNVSYSYAPNSEGSTSEKIEVSPTNIMPAGKSISLKSQPKKRASSNTSKYSINILSPSNEFSVPPGQRDLIIAVSLQPQLKHGDHIGYYMNGELLGKNTYNNFSIPEISRGEHKLSAKVIDTKGNILSTSGSITVFVHRVSVAR